RTANRQSTSQTRRDFRCACGCPCSDCSLHAVDVAGIPCRVQPRMTLAASRDALTAVITKSPVANHGDAGRWINVHVREVDGEVGWMFFPSSVRQQAKPCLRTQFAELRRDDMRK